ncbi:hypothetical protein [Nonomuraea sp. NPDC049480]|uniref:hypothetical protein n=1 Tax=Nonomuraea sp. NPDC049480 TaxID=3364353 RepID=UPI0037A2A250
MPNDGGQELVFSQALADLYEHAGRPTYAELIRQATAQRPPLKLTDSSLSDWLTGVSVPSSASIVMFLVSYLQNKAARNGYQSQPMPQWLAQREQAQRARRAGRSGRPRTRVARDSDSSLDHVPDVLERLGWPLTQVDPIALEVHPAIDAGAAAAVLGSLPAYLPRAHDQVLADLVAEAEGGASRIVVLVGGSSTGKTRALWEAVRSLREPWRLWHPIDPSHPQAALAGLRHVRPHTVVWLNESQHYLLTADETGEQVAAALRELLRTNERGPVLVMATLWPEYATMLSTVPKPGEPDRHPQARNLLKGAELLVPDTFTGPELDAAAKAGNDDPRLAEAVQRARFGALTQYLAGGPALIERYQTATVEARAVLHAAMDARRLGHGAALPRLLLEQAAVGYMSQDQWDLLSEDWLEQTFAYLTDPRPCRGALPPIARIRSRPGSGNPQTAMAEPYYRLADYLEQHGTRSRRLICPPTEFWDAATQHAATPADHAALAISAYDRGRYRYSYNLWGRLAAAGSAYALQRLAGMRERAGDEEEAEQLYRAAAADGDTNALWCLARMRQRAGDQEEAEQLYRAAAVGTAHWDLIRMREQAGDQEGAEQLARTATDTRLLIALALKREQAGDQEGAERLARTVADTNALMVLALTREESGDQKGAERLAQVAADAGNTKALFAWVLLRGQAGDQEGAERLARTAADVNADAVLALALMREQAGDQEGAKRLAQVAADAGSSTALSLLTLMRKLEDRKEAERLARAATDTSSVEAPLFHALIRERAGDKEGAEQLARTAADTDGDTDAVWILARMREQAGDKEGAEQLARTAADTGSTEVLLSLALMREQAGDQEGAQRLAQVAADTDGQTDAVWILARMRERAGDKEGAEQLARTAADAYGDTAALRNLAWTRERAGDHEEAERLAFVAADAGDTLALQGLAQKREQAGTTGQWSDLLRFGLEADGQLANPW